MCAFVVCRYVHDLGKDAAHALVEFERDGTFVSLSSAMCAIANAPTAEHSHTHMQACVHTTDQHLQAHVFSHTHTHTLTLSLSLSVSLSCADAQILRNSTQYPGSYALSYVQDGVVRDTILEATASGFRLPQQADFFQECV